MLSSKLPKQCRFKYALSTERSLAYLAANVEF